MFCCCGGGQICVSEYTKKEPTATSKKDSQATLLTRATLYM